MNPYQNQYQVGDIPATASKTKKSTSLSDFFPKNTAYFYSFPSGENSNFYNGVLPHVEELVAARPAHCAGENIRVVSFASTSQNHIRSMLENDCGHKLISRDKMIVLPAEITSAMCGNERNEKVKNALKSIFGQKELVMAQPFLDEDVAGCYQIPPSLTHWLNDKKNLPYCVPAEHLAPRYATFANGVEFASTVQNIPLPCVAKISSSSAGDGVRICITADDLQKAKEDFKERKGMIFVEKYIEIVKNVCVQFGIPHSAGEGIRIIGFNSQVIAGKGEFLGGVVFPDGSFPVYEKIQQVLLQLILPHARSLGWYGVGGIDVIVDASDNFYFIDANFRMTATFVFVCAIGNEKIMKPVISFIGEFRGTEQNFRDQVLKVSKKNNANQLLEIISLSQSDDLYRFNAGMLFDHKEAMSANAATLLHLGIKSSVLEKLSEGGNYFRI